MTQPHDQPKAEDPGCNIDQRKFCEAMTSCLVEKPGSTFEPVNRRKPGFTHHVTTNINSGEETYRGIKLIRHRRDAGILLNFCPFCSRIIRVEGRRLVILHD